MSFTVCLVIIKSSTVLTTRTATRLSSLEIIGALARLQYFIDTEGHPLLCFAERIDR
jgi:hypothetical protein